jgi:hypothetical protein
MPDKDYKEVQRRRELGRIDRAGKIATLLNAEEDARVQAELWHGAEKEIPHPSASTPDEWLAWLRKFADLAEDLEVQLFNDDAGAAQQRVAEGLRAAAKVLGRT